jgi:hypothetical protein
MPRPPYDDRVREQREKDRPSTPVEDEPDYGSEAEEAEPPVGVCVDQVLLAAVEACPQCELFEACGCYQAWYVRRTSDG